MLGIINTRLEAVPALERKAGRGLQVFFLCCGQIQGFFKNLMENGSKKKSALMQKRKILKSMHRFFPLTFLRPLTCTD